MYCSSCGASVKDGQLFCGKCGAKTNTAGSGRHAAHDTVRDIKKKGAEIVSNPTNRVWLVAAAAVAGIIMSISLLFGGGYKKPIKQMINGLSNENMRMVEKSVYNASLLNSLYYFGELGSLSDVAHCPGFRYRFVKSEKMDADDRESWAEYLEPYYPRVTDGYGVQIHYTTNDDYYSDGEFVFYVLKANGRWCVADIW